MNFKQINSTYRPILATSAGTYRLNVGPWFYIGGTTSFGHRHSSHKQDLANGCHQNKKLQDAWNKHHSFEFICLAEIPSKDDDKGRDHERRIQLQEQILLDQHFTDPHCCNESESASYNSTIAAYMRQRWQNPEFRAMMEARLKQPRGPVSPETRAKMSNAKKGAKNYNSRPVVIHFQGKDHHFHAARNAADFFGVTQQAMDQWLKGTSGWPKATGKTKAQNRHLAGMTGRFL